MPTGPEAPRESDSQRVRTARLIAIVTGLLGLLLALATPFLPVKQEAASIDWPQGGTVNSVSSPLISYSPTSLDISIPCSTLGQLGGSGGTLLSTMPNGAPDRNARGLTVRTTADRLEALTRDSVLISAPLDQLSGCTAITITTNSEQTVAAVTGIDGVGTTLTGDYRPQVVGIFTDLQGAAPAGLSAHMDVDSRFSSSPTLLKLFAMIVAALSTIVSLYALHRIDGVDGRRARRFLPARWWKFTGIDALVIGTLALWHVFGANTSDDGYLLGMARVSEHSGYMANYFRWFGVPEAPFGWYYDVLALFAKVSTASMWMRLPALIAGILCWMVISREVIPRLGVAVRRNKVAIWTGGLVFLAFWLPYNNGLRPEPIIALGALLTWCSIERAIATGRLLPAAMAVLIAAFSLAAGPSGLIAIGALIAGARPILQILIARGKRVGFLSQVMPILAAGTVVLVAVFADQTLATVLESTRVRTAVGPNVPWFEERLRWDALMTISPDGSLARRFGMFVMIVGLVFCVMMILRKGRIPGTAIGPSRRILGIVFASLLLMQFTPTKWTHHFGVFAGLAGSLGALAAVAVSAVAMRSRRNRTLFAAAVLFICALSFATVNGWWYVSNFGVPWSNDFPQWQIGFTSILLGLAVVALLVAAWFHFSGRAGAPPNGGPRRWGAIAQAPLAIATWALVTFEVVSLTVAMAGQYPAWTVGRSNLEALAGKTCGMAEDVMVEQDPNEGILTPIDVPIGEALGSVTSEGFRPNGIPTDVSADPVMDQSGAGNFADTDSSVDTESEAGTEGGTTAAAGVNGSRARLPYGLDPARTPVLGSWRGGTQQPAVLRSAWYRLPAGWSENDREDSLLVVSAAGRFDPGEVVVQWAGENGEPAGEITFGDVGAAPAWRNLRAPLSAIPADATRIRLVATDDDLSPEHWIALTPPRIPALRTLQDVVGSTDPVFLDWLVGLAFPCQRPFDHRNGVMEVPKWRILPDRFGAEANSPVMDYLGGGPLGITELLVRSTSVPTYLKHDWFRDWGALQQFTPYYPDTEPARLDLGSVTRSGLWSPAPLRLS